MVQPVGTKRTTSCDDPGDVAYPEAAGVAARTQQVAREHGDIDLFGGPPRVVVSTQLGGKTVDTKTALPDYSSYPDALLAKEETAASLRGDGRASHAIGAEWARRKAVRAEPSFHEPSTFTDSGALRKELAKHQRYVEVASNPFNGVPDPVRAAHAAHVEKLESRLGELDAQARARHEQSAELVKALRTSGVRLTPEEETKLRAGYENMLAKRNAVGPEIRGPMDGEPLAVVQARYAAHWQVVDRVAHDPFAAAALAGSLANGDDAEQALARMDALQPAAGVLKGMAKTSEGAGKMGDADRKAAGPPPMRDSGPRAP